MEKANQKETSSEYYRGIPEEELYCMAADFFLDYENEDGKRILYGDIIDLNMFKDRYPNFKYSEMKQKGEFGPNYLELL